MCADLEFDLVVAWLGGFFYTGGYSVAKEKGLLAFLFFLAGGTFCFLLFLLLFFWEKGRGVGWLFFFLVLFSHCFILGEEGDGCLLWIFDGAFFI